MKQVTKHSESGFTLVELLVSLFIFGILLSILGSFISSSQRVTNVQKAQTTALTDARSIASYLSEQVAQASYIYPLQTNITVNLKGIPTQLTTSKTVLAMLVPDNTVLCSSSAQCRYKGVIYFLDRRARYSDQVSTTSMGSDQVLVQGQTSNNLPWPANTVPATTLNDWTTLGELIVGVQGEDLDATQTNLMRTDPVTSTTPLSTQSSFARNVLTDADAFNTGIIRPDQTPTFNQTNALINAVGFKIAVMPRYQNSKAVSIDGGAMARNIPRAN